MVEPSQEVSLPGFAPTCYLCPGNERAGSARNPDYQKTFVFDNDFSALLPTVFTATAGRNAMMLAESERGICRVVCFSPRHDLTLAEMDLVDVRQVVDEWARQYAELGAIEWVRHVQIFENRGAMMGTSNPHPHGQIWAEEHLPNEPAKELNNQNDYYQEHGRCLLCDYLAAELTEAEHGRVITSNASFVALVPFWAIWPFETMLLPVNHTGALTELTAIERDDLADILQKLVRAYNRLFAVPFPYSMGFHQKPTDGAHHPAWHLHAHFYPPLLRSASVRKFMVGYEMLGQPQRDLAPESAAETLRKLFD
jgi:UDPglucose--hexose-1-phosphate uridylyltransferase